MSRRTFFQQMSCAVAAIAASCVLAGCQHTNLGTPTAETEDSRVAASPANIDSLTDVVTRNPNDPQAYNVRGSVYGQGGRNQEALADFNKALSLDPNFAQ